MNEIASRPEFRFGRTIVAAAVGDVLGQDAEAIVVAANRRGVLGPLATPGISGLRSLGGSEIERQAMALAPLDLGAAILTRTRWPCWATFPCFAPTNTALCIW